MSHSSHASVTALLKLLEQHLRKPARTPAEVLMACESQGTLARYKNEALGIRPMALNTLKTVADLVIEDGGWGRLDEARKVLRTSSSKSGTRTSRPSARDQLQNNLVECREAVDKADRSRLLTVKAYLELLNITREACSGDSQLDSQLKRHTIKWEKLFSLTVIQGSKRHGH